VFHTFWQQTSHGGGEGEGTGLFHGLLEFTKHHGESSFANQRLVFQYPVLLFLWCIKCELIYSCHRVDNSFCLCIYAKLTEPKIHVGNTRNFLKFRKDHHLENGWTRQ